ncbi:MAG: DNA-processing protein DprA [Rudaea sp.]|uniref:DNA-processing protein DprA n=1 Tax=unclassified Rudaea TaxID=2627037 RepID=UPI0010F6CD05|nr:MULTISPECIES: DNA-processing protein DprA [unclassified Rudaea]MBN8885258.1 DNA-processing protein DprA [Rudaea sp.]
MSDALETRRTRAWLTLLRAPGLGAAAIRDLLARHGDASTALERARREAPEEARSWLAAPDSVRLAEDEAWLAEPHHHLLVCDSEDFPVLLREIGSAPAALFVIGDPALLWTAQIAVVGARSASAAGVANARAFARAFALAGNTVTSGLAEGIDGAAHAAALDAGGKTVAVLGTGIDLVYPLQHAELAARIAASGALVSEYPPGVPGHPKHFPRRNRIISGLSLGTLVVEASLKSGSLTTARYAAEQGREVFALPGSIHSPLARGCHKLIREGAKLVETAGEVLEELHGVGALLADGLRERLATTADGQDAAAARFAGDPRARDPDYAALTKALGPEPVALDELALRTGLAAASLSSMLLMLELDGLVVAENGRYARKTPTPG